MNRKKLFWHPAIFAFLCAMFLLLSCDDDAPKNDCLEGQSPCDGVCVALDTKENCGNCRNTCTFDRICKKNVEDVYQCACPEGKTNCGNELSCSSLDGGMVNFSDKRCGTCNTICASSEQCKDKNCVCPIGVDGFLSDAGGIPLSGQALSEEYLRNDDNCGGCGSLCDTKNGQHCVLGQCTKTECNDAKGEAEECHFTLADGREECQPCRQKCRLVGGELNNNQTPLIPVFGEGENAQLNESNTSPEAYKEVGGLKIKRVLNCKCGEQLCLSEVSDRCDAKQCVCGVNSDVCSSQTSCTALGCKAPCDDLKRACAGKATCSKKQCQCLGALPQEPSPDPAIAHCVDGLVCGLAGKCYCPSTGGKDVECGVRGDHCVNDKCICGSLKGPCLLGTICKDGLCLCGTSETCDALLSPNCVKEKCVCGTDAANRLCNENQKCVNNVCACLNDKACLSYGSIGDKRGQADKCTAGKCVCGSTGGPCLGSRVCANGKCLCTKNTDCSANETCDNVSGQCTCGGAKACNKESLCTKDGVCECKSNTGCNDSETCKNFQSFGKICVCDPNNQQKACRFGAQCARGIVFLGDICVTKDPSTCYEGEKITLQGCACGTSNQSCRPGETCLAGHCK